LSVAYAILVPQRQARIVRPGQEGRPPVTSAAIYARVSSARQKKDETIGSQTAALREHAAQSRLDVPAEWIFQDEGHSGATLVRPALEALRDLVAQGCVDVVLVYSPDRLARKFACQALLLEEFARAGVRAEFVKGPARRQPRGPAAGPVPGHLRRVRESPAGRTVPARQGPPRPHRVGERPVRCPVRLPVPPQDRPGRRRLRGHRG
jgi:Site-specific recombinases, DNA invertase Pin homologs